ncbi:AVN_HP_G0120130.mRNA.1.CDS.1 [Saccharomyces cerevisiae]|nr:AVN_HP_G0120130.mRNA.1.CDS.1 [Saccharomyces cerevisiae]CAI6997214.1 AVN_HP_G0120130.mRNA.1.CDS.1 [Saccharomyces cerevisiae]
MTLITYTFKIPAPVVFLDILHSTLYTVCSMFKFNFGEAHTPLGFLYILVLCLSYFMSTLV